ncbi:LIM domain-binding protein 2-like isoform X2 [Xenia sp. Carnegie-2017]|uniref:LIM domain-binding protein 2-like isoform X2 n=1 Tax=Xenia sp. Carnegie-2017 TaxID=2897299 RepID=UPI001F0456C0|nr:LIM domain-binding protein 2-like isoform X2 [Xenia sp. Carnegie-2017]
MPSVPLPSPSFSQGCHTSFANAEYRIYELNKRLQEKNEADILWWNAFTSEFFEDDATMTLNFCLDDGPRTYTIGRRLIPRYFRSIFESGATDLSYTLIQPKESYQNSAIILDCDRTIMTTTYLKRLRTKVVTEGRLLLEFLLFDDLMRIRNWHFNIHHHEEYIPRRLLTADRSIIEEQSKNITCRGMTSHTHTLLNVCFILEPMQELMSRQKTYRLNPRDCLISTLFERRRRLGSPVMGAVETNHQQELPWQAQQHTINMNKRRTSSSKRDGSAAPRTKRRQGRRKPSTPTSSTPNANLTANTSVNKKKNASPSRTVGNFGLTAQDVMVVGEPSLMGGELCDEDERLITRLENTGYDSIVPPEEEFRNSPLINSSPVMPPWSGEPPRKVPAAEETVNE